jgi:ABC-type multidrug transport system ATPase subunit
MKVHNLAKTFDSKPLFSNVSFEFENGLMEISGPSGCGKTTLLNLLSGLDTPSEGRIEYQENHPIFSYAGQDSSCFYYFSVKKNMKFLGLQKKVKECLALAKKLSFERFIDKPLIELSGGERMKGEIILSLLKDADYYIFDEPFAPLDEASRKELLRILNELKLSKKVIVVNHVSSLELNADILVVFVAGKVEVRKNQGFSNTFNASKLEVKANRKHLGLGYLCSIFNRHPLDVLVKFLLCTMCFAFFCLGVSYTDTKNSAEKYLISLNNDPFPVHRMSLTDDSPCEDAFFEMNDKKPVLHITSSRTYLQAEIVGSLESQSKDIYYFSNVENDSLIVSNQEVYSGSDTYSLKIVSFDYFSSRDDFDIQITEVLEGKDQKRMFFSSASFIDSILLNGTGSLSFQKDKLLSFEPLSGISLEPGKAFFNRSGNIRITSEKGYHVSVHGFEKGQKLSVYTDGSPSIIEEIPVTERFEDNEEGYLMKMSIASYKDLLLHLGMSCSYPLTYLINRADFMKVSQYGLFTPLNIIPSPTAYKTLTRDYYYAFSAISLCGELVFIFLSSKGRKGLNRNLRTTFKKNGSKVRSFDFWVLISSALNHILPLILSFFLYPLVLIPFVNHANMIMMYPKCPTGYFNYSMEPFSSYYDSMLKPIAFTTFEPVFFLIIAIFLLIVLADSVPVILSLKKENK